jgi:hypothetical protein
MEIEFNEPEKQKNQNAILLTIEESLKSESKEEKFVIPQEKVNLLED